MLIKFAYKINSPLVIIYMNPKKKKKRHKTNPRKKENKRSKKKIMMRRGRAKGGGGEIDEETNDFCNFGWATGAIAPPTFPPLAPWLCF